MLTSAGFPPDDVHNIKVNTLWDGFFHASTYVLVGIGLRLLWRAAHRFLIWGAAMFVGGRAWLKAGKRDTGNYAALPRGRAR